MNFESLSEIIFLNNSQSDINSLFNKAFAYTNAFYVIFSGIIFTFFEVLSVVVKTKSNSFDRVRTKSIAIVLNKMINATIDISSLYV